jgi:hypothetical protein
MPIPLTGSFSFQTIVDELGYTGSGTISFIELCMGEYVPINQYSDNKPDSTAPYSMDSWRGYDHNALPSTLYFNTDVISGPNLLGELEYGSQYEVRVESNETIFTNKININKDGISQIFISDSFYANQGLTDSFPDGFDNYLSGVNDLWNSGRLSEGETASVISFQGSDYRFEIVILYTKSRWGSGSLYFTYSNGGVAVYFGGNTDSSLSEPYYTVLENGDITDSEYIRITNYI